MSRESQDRQERRLEQLLFMHRYLKRELARVEGWIAAERKRQAERRRGEQERPPIPDWVIEVGVGEGRPPVYVHAGACHMIGGRRRAVSREVAIRELAAGIEACSHCRPDTDLGILGGLRQLFVPDSVRRPGPPSPGGGPARDRIAPGPYW